jgi:predicted nucleic acid-binding protein
VDSSAFYAILDASDDNHVRAKELWTDLVAGKASLFTSSYVLVETMALLQQRLGMAAVRTLQEDILPVVQVQWIGEAFHQAGGIAALAAGRPQLSLVDCVSFEVMRALGIRAAFAFDRLFDEQGVSRIPR